MGDNNFFPLCGPFINMKSPGCEPLVVPGPRAVPWAPELRYTEIDYIDGEKKTCCKWCRLYRCCWPNIDCCRSLHFNDLRGFVCRWFWHYLGATFILLYKVGGAKTKATIGAASLRNYRYPQNQRMVLKVALRLIHTYHAVPCRVALIHTRRRLTVPCISWKSACSRKNPNCQSWNSAW